MLFMKYFFVAVLTGSGIGFFIYGAEGRPVASFLVGSLLSAVYFVEMVVFRLHRVWSERKSAMKQKADATVSPIMCTLEDVIQNTKH